MSENIPDDVFSYLEKIYQALAEVEKKITFLKFDNAWLKMKLEHETGIRKINEENLIYGRKIF